jgi:hypothetical protein
MQYILDQSFDWEVGTDAHGVWEAMRAEVMVGSAVEG